MTKRVGENVLVLTPLRLLEVLEFLHRLNQVFSDVDFRDHLRAYSLSSKHMYSAN